MRLRNHPACSLRLAGSPPNLRVLQNPRHILDQNRPSGAKNGDMCYEIEANYKEQWLFPPTLEDLLPAGHPARLVREFVDAMDLKGLGFESRAADTGRPNYSVSLLIKVVLYGYMNRTRSGTCQ